MNYLIVVAHPDDEVLGAGAGGNIKDICDGFGKRRPDVQKKTYTRLNIRKKRDISRIR